MVTIPTDILPTAVVASIVTLIGNWGLNELNRWRKRRREKKNELSNWYERAIEICEDINWTYTVLKSTTLLETDDILIDDELLDEAAVQFAQEEGLDMGPDEARQWLEEQGAISEIEDRFQEEAESTSAAVSEVMFSPIVDDLGEHYYELRRHITSRPREINEDQLQEVTQVLNGTYGLQLELKLRSHDKDVSSGVSDFEEDINSAVKKCERNIEEIEKTDLL